MCEIFRNNGKHEIIRRKSRRKVGRNKTPESS
jgi:hypothetical protein